MADKRKSEKYQLLYAEEAAIANAQNLIMWLMDEKSVSQKNLAEKLGVSQSAISQILSLSPKNLSLRKLARIIHVLGDRLVLSTNLKQAKEEEDFNRFSHWLEEKPWKTAEITTGYRHNLQQAACDNFKSSKGSMAKHYRPQKSSTRWVDESSSKCASDNLELEAA